MTPNPENAPQDIDRELTPNAGGEPAPDTDAFQSLKPGPQVATGLSLRTLLQERTRSFLAGGILLLLGATLGGVGYYVFTVKDKDPESRELITLIWTSQVTLASSALGFYFGSK